MHKIDQELHMMLRGEFDDAWKVCEELEQETPDDPRHMFNRGWFLIRQGRFQEGFQFLEAGRFLDVYGSGRINTQKPLWCGEDLSGKVVLINLESGYGDQIISSRFIPEVKKIGGTAVVCCAPGLKSIISRSFGVKCISYDEIKTTRHDYWIPGFSCSWLFGHTRDTIPNDPYLIANSLSVDLWKTIIDTDKIKIGIRWSGNPEFEHQQFRSFPTEPMLDIAKHDEFQLHSFQRDNDLRELPDNITDLQHMLISWEDTLAALANMDLVITSCTSIAHASAAMGKETWVIVPILPYHVWAYGAPESIHSPWYPETTRIFRQSKFGSWKEPFIEIEKELKLKYNLE